MGHRISWGILPHTPFSRFAGVLSWAELHQCCEVDLFGGFWTTHDSPPSEARIRGFGGRGFPPEKKAYAKEYCQQSQLMSLTITRRSERSEPRGLMLTATYLMCNSYGCTIELRSTNRAARCLFQTLNKVVCTYRMRLSC
jgi:hypothetical protein